MYKIMVAGAGKIGSLIACLLADSGSYQVHLADVEFNGADVKKLLKQVPSIKAIILDLSNQDTTAAYLTKHHIGALISSLPFFLNHHAMQAAKAAGVHYFDLTEDTASFEALKSIAHQAKAAFISQCGLAPGFVNIVANSLIQEFESCDHVKLRVGALPQRSSNALQYSLTWSTDGLINEYANPCYGLSLGKRIELSPLEGLESLQIDGCHYEAFNTSGGLGSLAESYLGKIQTMNYKSIRYPGHCEKIRFLMNQLGLKENRPTLKRILEQSIPKTYQDLVIIYVSVEGKRAGELIEKNYLRKIYPVMLRDLNWSAIQISTASSACVLVDLVIQQPNKYQGLVLQEQFSLSEFLENRFGQYYL